MRGHGWVRTEYLDSVAIVRFQRAPANALDLDSVAQLGNAIREVADKDEVRGVVLTGTGDYFCAGLDLKFLAATTRDQQRTLVERVNQMVAVIYSAPVPLVAAVNGHAVAGGLVLALLCEHRLGADGAFKIGLSEVRVGVPFPGSSLEVIKAELGPVHLRRLALTGGSVDPRGALEIGILDQVMSPPELMEAAVELAKTVGSMPRDGYARIKSQLRGATVARLREVADGADPMLDEWLR